MSGAYPLQQQVPTPNLMQHLQPGYAASRPSPMIGQTPMGHSVPQVPSVPQTQQAQANVPRPVAVPQSSQPSAGSKPTQPVGSNPSSQTPSTFKAAEAAPAAKRNKKRKAPERNLPEKVTHIIPESALFNRLCEYEKRINDLLQHKKSDIREVVSPPEHLKKKVRLYIFHTHSNQNPDAAQKAGEPPSWVLTIHGRLLDPATASAATPASTPTPPTPQPASKHGHPLSYYVRKLEVKLDPAIYPGSTGVITWEKNKHQGAQKDSFEIRRKGNKPVDVSIAITWDWQPARYQLPRALAELLGLQYETRARILQMLWLYIKSKKLLSSSQPQTIDLDEPLKSVFEEPQIKLSSVSERLTKLLEPMPPLEIKYTIKLDGPSPSHPDCYDVDFEVPGPSSSERMSTFFDKYSKDREVESIDVKISAAIRKINEHRRRRAFYLGFSHSPVDFINSLVASQARDLRIAKNANGRDFEMERRTEVFKQKWVEDAVMKYLHKKMTAGH